MHDLNILWNYHKEVYKFHTGDFIKDATHPFQSNPGGWLVLNRPLGIASTSGDNTRDPELSRGRGVRQADPGDRHAGAVVGRCARPVRRGWATG